MLFVAVNGSPQKEGNTAKLLEQGLTRARQKGVETSLIQVSEVLRDSKHPFCVQCSEPCNGLCFQDNRLGEAYDLLRRADAVLIGSPVYFGTVSAQLKAFWDKTRLLRKEKALLNTVGGVVTAGAARFGGQETTANAIMHMMLVQGMTIVGDGYQEADCGHLGASAQKPAEADENGQRRVRILVDRMLEVAEVTMVLRQRLRNS